MAEPPDKLEQNLPGHVEDVTATSPEDERVAELIEHTIDVPEFAEAVSKQEAPDAADTLEGLEEEEAAEILEQMEEEAAAMVLAEMQRPLAVGMLQDLIDDKLSYATGLLSRMAPDDAADLLQAVGETYREEILAAMDLPTAASLRKLVGYDEESAGGIMTTDFVVLREDMTVADATEAVRAQPLPEEVQHLMVLSASGRLVGIVGLRDLLIHPAARRVSEIMAATVKVVRPELDREQVAREFDRYDYSMLPVVDLDERLIGIVTVDDVIDIIRAEQTEDVQMYVGAGRVEAVYSPVAEKFKGRFGWLATSLVLTCAAAVVLLIFMDLIGERPILAWLAAVIAPVVGNAGHQALAVTLRGIIVDEVRPGRVATLLSREAMVGLLIGLPLGAILALALAVVAKLSPQSNANWQLGIVAGGSLAVAMVAGKVSGAAVPLLMRRLGADPAHASAIFMILITDGVSYTTFLLLTFALAGWLC